MIETFIDNVNLKGLSKLQSTSEEIKILQIQLEDMKPALELAAKDADIMITKIAADTVSLYSVYI